MFKVTLVILFSPLLSRSDVFPEGVVPVKSWYTLRVFDSEMSMFVCAEEGKVPLQ